MERAIYTYCFAACDTGNPGWGFYACSPGLLQHITDEDALTQLLNGTSYSIPELKQQWFTQDQNLEQEEASIREYHPEKFAFRAVSYEDQALAFLTYGKNLGRETRGQLRPGNALIYSLVGGLDEITDYPACYYGDPAFAAMRRSSFVEGQNTIPPTSQLPTAQLTPHGVVSEESVMAFLQADETRAEQLEALFYSLLNERTGLHRAVIICDEKENIIYWIAAMTMLLPLETAKQVYFTTYDYLGTASRMEIPVAYQICGVYSPTLNGLPECKATAYDVTSLANSTAAVLFDTECGIVPKVQTDAFSEVIRAFASGDPEPLRKFRSEMTEQTVYRDFGAEYTKFYPLSEKKPELFQYYSAQVRWDMLQKCYPAFGDPNADTALIARACVLTCLSLDMHMIDAEQVKKDIMRFTRQVMLNPDADTDILKNLGALYQRIGVESSESLIKNFIAQNIREIIESFKQGDTNEERIFKLAEVLSPFNNEERKLLQQLLDALSRYSTNIADGNEKRGELVKYLLLENYSAGDSQRNPSGLVHLFELVDANDKMAVDCFCDQLLTLYPKWKPERRAEALKAFEKANDPSIRDRFFKYFTDWIQRQSYTAVEMVRMQNQFANEKLMFAKTMKEICIERIETEKSPAAQLEAVREHLRLSTAKKDKTLNQGWCIKIAGDAIKNTQFQSLDEVAELAIEIAAVCGITPQFAKKIAQTAVSVGYTKSAWKRALHNASEPEYAVLEMDELRKRLAEDVENYVKTQEEAAPPTVSEEKKSGKFLGLFKKKK